MLFINAILFIAIFTVENIEASNNVCSIPSDFRFDCNPDDPSNKETCESRGCCWYSNGDYNGSPKCFFPTNYQGYVIKDIENRENGVTVRLTRNFSSGLPQDVSNLNLEVIGLDNERVRIRLVDADASRFEVPMPFLNVSQSTTINSPLYSIKINRDTGNLQITRQSTGTSIFNVDLSKLIYANQFIQLSSLLVNNFLYGLGEHKDTFRKTIDGWKRYTFEGHKLKQETYPFTLFAGGTNPTENINLYASYPFYLMIEPDKQAHGVFLLNSNAMDIITQPAPAITWRTIGGILDFFIFLGPTAPQVIRQNVNLIGRPVMQPYWSLGFHLCRYDYKSTNKTRETFFRNIQAGIPIETQWNDIDYMYRYNDFTVDPVNFAGLSEFVNELHSMKLHYALIMDAGVSGSEAPGSYPPFDDGKKDDIFIKNESGEIFLGRVWNFETTAFPDFTNPATLNYWTKQFIDLKNQVDYDGVWIDMNEPYNFHQIMPCPNNSYEYPPYTPGIQPLNNNTICMSCKQHGGLHYNVHSLFGLLETVATYEAVKNITGIRPFILSRSTFPSHGHYGSHWSGDIRSTWDFMKYSISNMLEFNIYGIPMIGSDICGFAGNTTEQLCMRWSSLGAFYPFSRNHNDFDTIEQDPVALGPKVVGATKYAVNLRYRLLPYLYTLFYEAHTKGDTVARPIFFEFPLDLNTYSIETSFMWGSGILIVPILEPDTKTVDAYFPEGYWYDFESLKLFVKSNGRYENITIDDDRIGVYARGGSIIPGYLVTAMSIADLSELPGYLFIFLDSSSQAHGSWFSDDGQSIENIQNGEYTYSHCKAALNNISCDYENVFTVNTFKIGGIMLVGVDRKPTSVSINGTQIDSYFYSDENQSLKIDFPENFDRLQSFGFDMSYK